MRSCKDSHPIYVLQLAEHYHYRKGELGRVFAVKLRVTSLPSFIAKALLLCCRTCSLLCCRGNYFTNAWSFAEGRASNDLPAAIFLLYPLALPAAPRTHQVVRKLLPCLSPSKLLNSCPSKGRCFLPTALPKACCRGVVDLLGKEGVAAVLESGLS